MNKEKSITIPAITIWQPHASLIFSERKRYETRHWKCPDKYIGRRVAIHAGLNQSDIRDFFDGFYSSEFADAVKKDFGSIHNLLPTLGCVIGTAVLSDCIETGWLVDPGSFGDFSPGRFAWRLESPKLFDKPIHAKGAQGFWMWKDER